MLRKEQIYADGKVTGWENKKSKKKESQQNQSKITKPKPKKSNGNRQKHNLMPAKTAKPKPEKTDTILMRYLSLVPLVQHGHFTQKVPCCWLYIYKYTRILAILQEHGPVNQKKTIISPLFSKSVIQ